MIERFDIQQNTHEWVEIKLGKFSASICAELLMDKKTVGYTGLIQKIIEERITGIPSESKKFQGNVFTDRGHELEPIARNDYEFRTLTEIKQIGVIELDEWVLCSPDGLIGDNGLYQAKCPIFNTQLEYLKTKKIPTNYYKQMQFELYVSGREYNVFNSYHPHLPPVDIIVNRDEVLICEIDKRLLEAKEEVLEEIEFIKSLR
jgi:hypothetical protein